MNTQIPYIYTKEWGQVRYNLLIFLGFSSIFFSRPLEALGASSIINLAHFAIIPAIFLLVISKNSLSTSLQVLVAQRLLFSALIFLAVMTASALLNHAGAINVVVDFLILTEPFIFLFTVIVTPLSKKSFDQLNRWIVTCMFLHIFLAYCQKILIGLGLLAVTRMTPEDNVQGVFYLSWGGHVVSGFVASAFAFYIWISADKQQTWLKAFLIGVVFYQILVSDAKQVILVLAIAWILLLLTKVADPMKLISYVIIASIVGFILYWCIFNLEAFAAFQTWIRPGLYGPDGKATLLKTAPLRIIPSYYKSPLNLLLGLGPGHTVGRLGGWLIEKYYSLLAPLGVTSHPATEAIWTAWRDIAWLDSSFFSPLWGWVGVWGDLGILGLFSYLSLWWVVWQYVCKDEFSKFNVLAVFVNGFVFTQLEEPGYIISIMMLIGLRWHEFRFRKQEIEAK